MTILPLTVEEAGQQTGIKFKVNRIINAGYTGRDTESVKAHIAELEKEGVAPPSSVPMVFPVFTHNITLNQQIEVGNPKTSGEVEFVLLIQDKTIYVGVGSDHSDRDLERYSIPYAKQICQNVLAPTVWKMDDVREGWDDLVMQSWTRESPDNETVLYQKGRLGSIMEPEAMMDFIRSNTRDGDLNGMIIYSGTFPALTPGIIYGSSFRFELIDERRKRTLSHEYQILELDYLKA